MRTCLLLILLSSVVSLTGLSARGYFAYSDQARQAYNQILSLRLEAAEASIAGLRSREPDNLIAHHLESYSEFFRLYISEDKQLYEQLLPRREAHLRAVQAGDPNSPYYRYVQAEIRLHWALIKLRFEDYLSAFRDINQAHKLLRENQELFPAFAPNKKDLAVLHAAVGTIPDQFRWGVKLLSSLDGTVRQGLREMEQFLTDRNSAYHQEGQVLYAFMLLHLANEPERAWEVIQRAGLRPAANPLHCFIMANVAMRTQRNDTAIRYLLARPRGGGFHDFPYLDYMLGMAKLRQLDPSGRVYLQSFLKRFRGIHFIKEAHQKIAWAELLRGDEAAYHQRMKMLIGRGTSSAGGDKNALKEAQSGKVPHLGLLKARLLFDGGYYQRALGVIDGISPDRLTTALEKLEYNYRIGRIYHGLKQYDKALAFYTRTIEQGRSVEAFFSCNAALQAGLIEEERGKPAAAERFFRTCLSIHPDEYQTGLHHQAKAGLARLK